MPSFKIKFSGVTILQGVEFSIFPIDFEWALQQCSATALPVMASLYYIGNSTRFARDLPLLRNIRQASANLRTATCHDTDDLPVIVRSGHLFVVSSVGTGTVTHTHTDRQQTYTSQYFAITSDGNAINIKIINYYAMKRESMTTDLGRLRGLPSCTSQPAST